MKFEVGILHYLLLIVGFFLGGCSTSSISSHKNPPSQEIDILPDTDSQVWMEKFFKEFFLEGASIYTLFGTKPISGEIIVFATEEDYKEAIQNYMEREEIDEKEKAAIFSQELKNLQEDDFPENWKKWVQFFDKYPHSPFIFAKHATLSKKMWSGHIMNVQETIWTLQMYYDVFKKELGYDFDPVSVVMEFKNEDSDFWKQVFANHLLAGIVYGYGYKNSYLFQLWMKFEDNPKIQSPRFSSYGSSNVSFSDSLEDLRLPKFRSFETPFNTDPVLEKYKLERKKIRSKLTNSNFFKMVFLQLTGELSNERQDPT